MSAIADINLVLIDESPLNPRREFDSAKLNELAASIREKGVQQPVKVRPSPTKKGRYELVYGHRRFRASNLIRADTIPAVVAELTDQQVLEEQLIENGQRADIHPLEEADTFKKLQKEFKLPIEEIATKVGKDKSYVYKRLKLCSLGKEGRKLALSGWLSPALSYLVARVPEKQQHDVLEEFGAFREDSEPPTLREASWTVQRNFMLQLKEAPFDTKDANLVPAAGSCTTCPKRTGNQPALFDDVDSKDVCTDGACFGKKRQAFTDRELASAKSEGRPVLTAKDAKEVFQEYGGLSYRAPYVTTDSICYDDPKHRTYGQLLGKKAEVTLGVDRKGDLHKLVPKAGLNKALKEAGHNFKSDRAAPAKKSPKQKEKEKQEKAADELAKKVLEEGLGRVVAAARASKEIPPELMNIIAVAMHDGGLGYPDEAMAKRHGVKSPAAVGKLASEGSPLQAAAVVVDHLFETEVDNQYGPELDQRAIELASLYGVDLVKLRNELAQEDHSLGAGVREKDHLHDEEHGARACIVPLCAKQGASKSLCPSHYSKAKRLGFNLDNLSASDIRKLGEDGRTARDAGVEA